MSRDDLKRQALAALGQAALTMIGVEANELLALLTAAEERDRVDIERGTLKEQRNAFEKALTITHGLLDDAKNERDALESQLAAQVASQAIAEREVIALQASKPPDGVAPESYAMGYRAGLERAAQVIESRCLSYTARKVLHALKPSRLHRCVLCDLAAAIRAIGEEK